MDLLQMNWYLGVSYQQRHFGICWLYLYKLARPESQVSSSKTTVEISACLIKTVPTFLILDATIFCNTVKP